MDAYERAHLCDGIIESYHNADEVIIKEGEEGNKFYMIAKGEF